MKLDDLRSQLESQQSVFRKTFSQQSEELSKLKEENMSIEAQINKELLNGKQADRDLVIIKTITLPKQHVEKQSLEDIL